LLYLWSDTFLGLFFFLIYIYIYRKINFKIKKKLHDKIKKINSIKTQYLKLNLEEGKSQAMHTYGNKIKLIVHYII